VNNTMLSIFDIFSIGIGPSSSHTVGPMRAAAMFAGELAGLRRETIRAVRVELFGSLALTGKGHGTDRAIVGGLEGETPELADPARLEERLATVRATRQLRVPGGLPVSFDEQQDLIFHHGQELPLHPNGMRFSAIDADQQEILGRVYYSIGGGAVVDAAAPSATLGARHDVPVPYPFSCSAELVAHCRRERISVSRLAMENEKAWRSEGEIREKAASIWSAMQDCVRRGCEGEGMLPGGLLVPRRAPRLYHELERNPDLTTREPLSVLDWVSLYALAAAEENASGGRVVTAPTNGSAGIVPAILHYYVRFCPGADDAGVLRFLLTAGVIGILYKQNASISGAEVGCQGEVGVACSMAAAGLTEVLGGTIDQVENAAEIAMEHHLGLTCDPIRGLVQIPCIERNALGAVQALSASRLALHGDGSHRVSLDAVIHTMRETGADMSRKYRETALGGLAVNVPNC
jgi:L-serine dehydratase